MKTGVLPVWSKLPNCGLAGLAANDFTGEGFTEVAVNLDAGNAVPCECGELIN